MGKSKELAELGGIIVSDDLSKPSFIDVNVDVSNGGGIGVSSPSLSDNRWIFFGSGTTNLDVQQAGIVNQGSAGSIGLATGGTTRMTIDASGRVTMPYQPAFYAYNLDFPNQTAGFAVGGGVMTNIASGYNGTTGRFTAPVTGTYVIHAMTQYYDGGSSTYQTVAIAKNGSSIGAESWHGNSGATGNYHTQANTCVIVTLSVNDYVQVYTYYGSRDIQNFFCGYLLG